MKFNEETRSILERLLVYHKANHILNPGSIGELIHCFAHLCICVNRKITSMQPGAARDIELKALENYMKESEKMGYKLDTNCRHPLLAMEKKERYKYGPWPLMCPPPGR